MQNAKSTLGLVIQWGSKAWVGGSNYLKNMVLAVAALLSRRRPRLVFLVRPDQVDDLSHYQAVLPRVDDVRLFAPGVQTSDIDLLYPFPGDRASLWMNFAMKI